MLDVVVGRAAFERESVCGMVGGWSGCPRTQEGRLELVTQFCSKHSTSLNLSQCKTRVVLFMCQVVELREVVCVRPRTCYLLPAR